MTPAYSPAELALRELGITDPKQIDVEVIAWHLGAKVKYRPLKSCEARIVGRDDRAIISVDNTKTEERQRFSVGHELGHWHHHRGRCLICRSDDIGNARKGAADPERVADGYAANLLMPWYIFNPFVGSFRSLSLGVLREAKKTFCVSLTAAGLRVIKSNRFPALLVCHTRAGRRWFRQSGQVPERWFPRLELQPESFAFDMIFGKAKEPPQPRRVSAGIWFDQPDAPRYQILEQPFALPDNEVATLLIVEDKEMLTSEPHGRRW